MGDKMNNNYDFIIQRLIKNAYEAFKEIKINPYDDFNKGRKLAYYEMLDTIKSELIVQEQNLSEFGLDIDLEKTFFTK